MARSHRADLVIRPVLDAGQTIPPFVYLIPVLALFGPSRFTAIVAGVIYAAPAAIKLVADGVRARRPATVEAARSTGSTAGRRSPRCSSRWRAAPWCSPPTRACSTSWPWSSSAAWSAPARSATTWSTALAHQEYAGKGIAAGLPIVLLGILIDRVTRRRPRRGPARERRADLGRTRSLRAHDGATSDGDDRPGRAPRHDEQGDHVRTKNRRSASRVAASAALALTACGGGSVRTDQGERAGGGRGR